MLRFLVPCALALVSVSLGADLKEEFAWKEMTYEWPSEDFKANAIETGAYIPENNLPMGLATWKNKLFITIPRWKAGVASSLNYVIIGSDKTSAMKPYPSWEANFIPSDDDSSEEEPTAKGGERAAKAEASSEGLDDDDSIVSVFRLWTDRCDRLWVMDTGLDNILGVSKEIAKPSLVVFDLKTDKLIRRYFFKEKDVEHNSLLANVVVDADTCDDAFAYIPDLGGYGLVVYSLKQDKSWRVRHHFFYFDPLAGQYKVGPVTFQWADGVFGVALSNKLQDGSRNVIFHAFSSTKEFQVSNKVLQNETWALSSENYHDFKVLGERGVNSQASASYVDENTGVLFYAQVNRDGVACWNTKKPLTPENTALFVSDSKTLEFPNDIKIDSNGTLWILSNRLPRFMYQSLDSKDINYRIFTTDPKSSIKGTVCA